MYRRSERVHGLASAELLVIVVIVVLIAIIVFPLVARARADVHEECVANLGSLGKGMLSYVADHDDHFPVSPVGTPGSAWGRSLLPYVPSPKQFRCASDATTPPDADTWPSGAAGYPNRIYSYGLNSNVPASDTLISPRDGHVNHDKPTHARLAMPAATVMFFEVSDAVGYLDTTPTSAAARSTASVEAPTGNTTGNPLGTRIPGGNRGQSFADGMNRDPHVLYVLYATGNVGGRILNGGAGSVPRHAGRANYCLGDGHATSLPPELVSGGSDAVDSVCDQGTTRSQVGKCADQKWQNAAGTSSSRYHVTFSTL